MNRTVSLMLRMMAAHDVGELKDALLAMRPEEYARFRHKVMLGRGIGRRSYQQALEYLGLRELHILTTK